MLRTILAAALATAIANPAQAQLLTTMIGNNGGSPPPSYVGPGDHNTYAFFAGVYAYTSATRGTKALNLCYPDAAHCNDVSTDATVGFVSSSQVVNGSTCNNSTVQCKVNKAYDKVGTSDIVSDGTFADMPNFVVNAVGSVPAIGFPGTNQVCLRSTTQPGTGGAWTISVVANRTSTGTQQDLFTADLSFSDVEAYYDTGTNTFDVYGGANASIAATDGTTHMVQGTGNGTGQIASDNTVSAQSTGTNNFVGSVLGAGCVSSTGLHPFLGNAFSFAMANSNFSSADLQSQSAISKTIVGY